MFLNKSFRFMGRIININEKMGFTSNSSDMGASSASDGLIIIRGDMPEDIKDETLLHEILEQIKVTNDLDVEHKELSIISNCLYAVLKDNKIIKQGE